jgi:hypothetical protein
MSKAIRTDYMKFIARVVSGNALDIQEWFLEML